jgi:hypothetical protein
MVTKKMQSGGPVEAMHKGMRKIMRKVNAPLRKTLKHVSKNGSGYKNPESDKAPAGFTDSKNTTPSTKKYQTGGTSGAQLKKEGAAMKAKGMAMKAKGQAQSVEKMEKMKRANNQAYNPVNSFKTGGMVNSNAKVTASKVAKGRPAKSAEPMSAAKKATGKVGGVSKAPKAAAPKMKMGGNMKRK